MDTEDNSFNMFKNNFEDVILGDEITVAEWNRR